MHAGGRGSDYEKSKRMKMDPCDTVKLRASLVTRWGPENVQWHPLHQRKRRERDRGEEEMRGGRELNVEELSISDIHTETAHTRIHAHTPRQVSV